MKSIFLVSYLVLCICLIDFLQGFTVPTLESTLTEEDKADLKLQMDKNEKQNLAQNPPQNSDNELLEEPTEILEDDSRIEEDEKPIESPNQHNLRESLNKPQGEADYWSEPINKIEKYDPDLNHETGACHFRNFPKQKVVAMSSVDFHALDKEVNLDNPSVPPEFLKSCNQCILIETSRGVMTTAVIVDKCSTCKPGELSGSPALMSKLVNNVVEPDTLTVKWRRIGSCDMGDYEVDPNEAEIEYEKRIHGAHDGPELKKSLKDELELWKYGMMDIR
jgi:hypothetical protein